MKNINTIMIFIFIVFVLGGCSIYQFGTNRYVTATVTDKVYHAGSGEDNAGAKYLIFTDDTTFENTDCLLWLKFDSSDIYGRIEVGKTYRFHVYGWRIPILSNYPNIISVREKTR